MPRATASDIDSCELSLSELQELWLGVGHNGSLFRDEDELRVAWDRARAVCMRLWATNGKRPMAWWYLEAPGLGLKWPGYHCQQSYLFEQNALGEAECEQLFAGWREEFERASAIKDPVARRKYLDWADVPHSLRRRWSAAARKPRAKRGTRQAPSSIDSGKEAEASSTP